VSACESGKEADAQGDESVSSDSTAATEAVSNEEDVTGFPAESGGADTDNTSPAEDGAGVQYCEDELFRFQIPEGSFQPKNSTGICMKPSEEYQMYLRELGAANGIEDIAEEDIERMLKTGYNYLGWIDDGRKGFKLVHNVEISSASEGAEVLYQEAIQSGFHDSETPEPFSVTRMETDIGGYPAYIIRQVGDPDVVGSQQNYVALIDAPTGEVVRFNYYIVDLATEDAVETIFASFEFK
jgi:hypothetical protein